MLLSAPCWSRWSRILALATLAVLQAANASATVHWVDGNDPTCGDQTPCHSTIQAAVDAAGAGDTVRVLAGAYLEQVTVADKNSASSSETDRIRIEADPMAALGSVLVSGTATDCETGGAIKLSNSHFITIEGLVVTAAAPKGSYSAGTLPPILTSS